MAVIPAKAGTQADVASAAIASLDPRLRGDDERLRQSHLHLSLPM